MSTYTIEYAVCYTDRTWNTYTREFDSSTTLTAAMDDIKAVCEEKLDNLAHVFLYSYWDN